MKNIFFNDTWSFMANKLGDLKSFGLDEALSVTLLGMLVVFSVLIIICVVLYVFGYIAKTQQEKSSKQENILSSDNKPIIKGEETQKVETNAVNDIPDYELIAVITAAIAAQENVSPDKLVVRNVR